MVTLSFDEVVLIFIAILAVILVTFYLMLRPKKK
jgi:preprotein translocase subunit YajC